MKNLVILISLLNSFFVGNLFSQKIEKPIEIQAPAYNNCDDGCRQVVRFSSSNHSLTWIWYSDNGNCNWGLNLPTDLNLADYKDGYLVIGYSEESNDGTNSPQIVILDEVNNKTMLLDLYSGTYKNSTEKQFKIPIDDFVLDNIDNENPRFIQFDKPFDRNNGGKIVISSIKLIKN